ncbi:uncharacterized protein LOC118487427 [Helianthus annuus]|uniref:uncharacterized protein LOC118487427 n=1 Tax=Helianthus annuus TaxID=4232 RepID=UPI001652E606|nr:uncharacterized protein LOC118487427 [Helianthus annuus]
MEFPTNSFLQDTNSSSSSDNDTLEFFEKAYNELEGSNRPKKKMVDRDRIHANEVLIEDYFVENPVYNAEMFRDHFRLPKDLFLKIVGYIEVSKEWFQEYYDGMGKRSFTPTQKFTSAIRQLAISNPPHQFDEYLAMSDRTSRECLQFFCHVIIKLYAKEFLRKPTRHDIACIYAAHEARWHLEWRNCPRELRVAYFRVTLKDQPSYLKR